MGWSERSPAGEELEVTSFPHRGCLHWVAIAGEAEPKTRPALVISIDARNQLAGDILVIPASTILRPAPTHVRLRKGEGGVPRTSMLKCEQITTLPKELISRQALGGPLARKRLAEIERAVLRAIGVPVG